MVEVLTWVPEVFVSNPGGGNIFLSTAAKGGERSNPPLKKCRLKKIKILFWKLSILIRERGRYWPCNSDIYILEWVNSVYEEIFTLEWKCSLNAVIFQQKLRACPLK